MTELELRNAVVNTIKSWHGAKMGSETHKKIIDTYNSQSSLPRGVKMTYTYSWCAATVSAAFITCNLTDIMPLECSCNEMIKLCNQKGIWIEDDAYIPKIGDVIFYDWDDSGKGDCKGQAEHVGIVIDVKSNKIYVEEGNKNNAVGEKVLAINGRYIRGFATPDYASKADKSTPISKPISNQNGGTCMIELNELKKGSKGNQVKTLQRLLNAVNSANLYIDGSFGDKTLQAVKAYQKKKGLYVDGIVGVKTWNSLLK